MREKVSWREMIAIEMEEKKESWKDVEECTLSDDELNFKFDNGYGGTEGIPFTIWTKNRVYFPVCYDGAEWCTSVSRVVDGEPTNHVGGG